MRKNILVLGGTGFIGRNLLKKLSKTKNNITSLSTGSKKKNINTIKNIEYLTADLANFKDLKNNINKDYEIIINLSGNIDHKNYNQTKKIHFQGLKNLLRIINLKKLNLFIQAGSSLEYGKLDSPQKEKIKCKPISLYGKAKSLSSEFLRKKIKKKVIILRLYQVYGPYQKFDRLIPHVIKSCIKNKKFECSDGLQLRDFLYVDDLVTLFNKIINNRVINYGIYNVGSGSPISVRKIIKIINNYIKKGSPVFGKIKMRSDETKILYPCISKISKVYKWKPKTNIFSGLKKTIKHYRKNIVNAK